MPPPQFKLAVYGRPGDCEARVSAQNLTGGSTTFVQEINAELELLPRALGPTEMQKPQSNCYADVGWVTWQSRARTSTPVEILRRISRRTSRGGFSPGTA